VSRRLVNVTCADLVGRYKHGAYVYYDLAIHKHIQSLKHIFTCASSMLIFSTLTNLHVRYYFSLAVPFTFCYAKFCLLFY